VKLETADGAARSVRVLVVDDFEPWRDFVSKTLRDEPELQIIATAHDGLEGVRQAQELQPDLILLDIGLPTLNGIEAARRIRDVAPNSRILFTTENRSWDIVQAALSTGATGYLVKSSAGRELLPAVDAVLRGKQFVSADLKHHALDADANRRDKVAALFPLRNVDCHELKLYPDDSAFVDGISRSIETSLEKGIATVIIATESHRTDLLRKLRADDVNVEAAVERRLLTLLDAADSISTFTVDAATEENRAIDMPDIIVAAVRTAKERHLHVAVG